MNIISLASDLAKYYVFSGKSESTNAGRRFEPERSENGKGITTTSPFTNLAMLYLLQ